MDMSHPAQQQYCDSISNRFNNFFQNKKVLDVGSLDINGNNRKYFYNCDYTGIDIDKGNNVDIVTKTHEYNEEAETFDTIISTECFEHDMYYEESLKNIVRLLKSGGLFVFTCATNGRQEHGTSNSDSDASPFTSKNPEWMNYYKNLTEMDIKLAIDVDSIFSEYEFGINDISHDLYFWGIKK